MWLMVSVHDFLALSLLDHNKESMAVVKSCQLAAGREKRRNRKGPRVK